jgi:Na+/pantothenate symporter
MKSLNVGGGAGQAMAGPATDITGIHQIDPNHFLALIVFLCANGFFTLAQKKRFMWHRVAPCAVWGSAV